jgi:hypothetical protein
MPANDDGLDIPQFLKIPQAQRNVAWENHRIVAKPISAAASAGDDWRKERNRLYNEAAQKEGASGRS